ncbi:ERF family protein [Pediococcus pentosaceus]|uniref:ERF family protein n=1 Tax=Pediococcus pentosaceus TaxID=1255 RepID=UPI003D77C21C
MLQQTIDVTKTPELNKALYETQKVLTQPSKNKDAHYGKYADLSAIDKAIRKAIITADSGISFSQGVIDDANANGKVSHKIYTVIRHVSGEEKIIYGDSFPDDSNMQKQGANETYAKRTSLCLAFGIVADDDDDGQGVSLLEQYQKKEEENRLKVIAYLKDNIKKVNKDVSERVFAVLGKKDKTLDHLSYRQALILSGALMYELSRENIEE